MASALLRSGAEIHAASGQYAPARTLLGKVYCAPACGVLFVPLYTSARPPERIMLAIRENDGRCVLPGMNADDYQVVAQHVTLNDTRDRVLYWLVSRCDFAVVERNTNPIRLCGVTEAANRGVPLRPDEIDRPNVSIWWQEWGGTVICCEHDAQTGLVNKSDILRESVGKYRRLPFWLFR
jgi:hypothetical protein